ncbi:hypothetical protein IMZ48_32970 [Candidatus Bathyarchaeota archaeon]|nr:hypothetical protein [Candidatus Bathyarchaeota archaeon]
MDTPEEHFYEPVRPTFHQRSPYGQTPAILHHAPHHPPFAPPPIIQGTPAPPRRGKSTGGLGTTR